MVREPRPRTAHMALDAVDREIAHVDAIEGQQRHLRGVAAGRMALGLLEDFEETELVAEVFARLLLPVVEVAGDDERSLLGARRADTLGEPLELEAAAARPQPQVHVDAVQLLLPARHFDLAMQQPAAFERMVRDVDVLPYVDRM